MPKITEIRDNSGQNPDPTVKEMRESQQRGGEGLGTNDETFKERLGSHGASVNGDTDDSDSY